MNIFHLVLTGYANQSYNFTNFDFVTSSLHFSISYSVARISSRTPRISGHFSIFGLVFFVLQSLLGTASQQSSKKFAILSPKPRSRVGILMSRTRAIADPTRPHLLCLCK